MPRKSHLFIAITLLVTLAAPVQAATPKAGAKCTKAGVTATTGGKKFTCVKSGTKLVWNKGVAIKKPTPVATPTATPTPEPSPSPTPTTTLTPTPEPSPTPTPTPAPIVLTWDNVAANVDQIPANVYNKAQLHFDPSYQIKFKLNVLVGPNTKPSVINPIAAITYAASMMRNYKQPDEVWIIYYNFVDKDWAKRVFQEKDGSSWLSTQVDSACPNEENCENGSGGNLKNWQGFAQMGIPKNPWWSDRSQHPTLDIHEFTHTVQSYQRKPAFSDWTSENPAWFSEGHATLFDKLGSSNSLASYNFQRNWVINRLPADATLKDFSPANILRFYDALAPGKVNPAMRNYVYTLGFSTLEALVAIAGIDSAMELVLQNTTGKTFNQAFKSVYGIEWAAAAPILAEVVSKQYMAKP